MNNQKPANNDIIERHVEYLKELNSQGKLILCRPFTDYPEVMVIILAKNITEEAKKSDSFIASGYKSFEIRTLELANKENNYLLE